MKRTSAFFKLPLAGFPHRAQEGDAVEKSDVLVVLVVLDEDGERVHVLKLRQLHLDLRAAFHLSAQHTVSFRRRDKNGIGDVHANLIGGELDALGGGKVLGVGEVHVRLVHPDLDGFRRRGALLSVIGNEAHGFELDGITEGNEEQKLEGKNVVCVCVSV